MSVSTVRYAFGSWRKGVEAAGLQPPLVDYATITFTDEELLQELIRLTAQLAKQPTEGELSAHGNYSIRPYKKRWKTLRFACEAAYAKHGFPSASQPQSDKQPVLATPHPAGAHRNVVQVPQTYKPAAAQPTRKIQFGEPLQFRGLQFAPINEQGVVYVFGMVSRELGFLIESVRTEYPDCEGKRCVDAKKQRWEHVRIEFEYVSSNFKEHGHACDGCELIVCWIHDWPECPIEVLELRSELARLPAR